MKYEIRVMLRQGKGSIVNISSSYGKVGRTDRVDVLGGAKGASYAFEYRAVDGVMLPTRRRVFAYHDARQKIDTPVLVSINLSEIQFT